MATMKQARRIHRREMTRLVEETRENETGTYSVLVRKSRVPFKVWLRRVWGGPFSRPTALSPKLARLLGEVR